MGVAVGDSEAVLEHYDGASPAEEVRKFCLRHGYADDTEAARAELATCTTTLGEALQARLTDLAKQRIHESISPTPAGECQPSSTDLNGNRLHGL